MLDIKFIRNNPKVVKKAIKDRGLMVDVDELLKVDKLRSALLQEIESMRGDIKEHSSSKPDQDTIKRLKQLKQSIKDKQVELATIERKYRQLMLSVPNIPDKDMPTGDNEEDNVEVKQVGECQPKSDWMRDHLEIGQQLDLIDTKQSAVVSGSRFAYLKNEAVLLQDALHMMLRDKLLKKNFTPMIPPVLVKEEVLIGTSHLPSDQDQVYKISTEYVEDKNQLYLVGSSEPSLFAYWMNKTLKETDLPQKMFALTSCFRTEVGSWGKDVRGIKRVHQFDKLEMDVVCHPNLSDQVMEELLAINEWFLQSLEIPYRVLNMCTGDAGYLAASKKYDVEVWLPSSESFMETMSDTNAKDFQARRLNIKYQAKDGEKKFVHTVNDTGCAMGRIIIALLENHQQTDGSVRIPSALQHYTGFKKISL